MIKRNFYKLLTVLENQELFSLTLVHHSGSGHNASSNYIVLSDFSEKGPAIGYSPHEFPK